MAPLSTWLIDQKLPACSCIKQAFGMRKDIHQKRNLSMDNTNKLNEKKKRECIVYRISGYHKQCTKCLTKKPKCLSIIVYHILVCTNNNYHYARNGSEHFIASDAHTLNSTFIHISFLVTFHGWDFCVYLCFRGSLH